MIDIDPSDIVTTEENEKIFFSYEVDLETNEVYDSGINPTDVEFEKVEWLYAANNKYPKGSVEHHEKTGKWMLFLKPWQVNQVWFDIKSGIAKGKLWHSKVTTNNPLKKTHAVMIYTKDYTDLEDVIRVLDYIYWARLVPRYTMLRYKADWQTLAGIYSGGTERPSIYASETIRKLTASEAEQAAARPPKYSSSIVKPPLPVSESSGLPSCEKSNEFITTTTEESGTSLLVAGVSNMTMEASHESVSSAAAACRKNQVVCKFFNRAPGSCNKGEACKFVHTT
jgi:hypothetical protein